MSEQAKFDMATSEKEEQEIVTFDDSSTNNSTEETQKVEVKADKNDRVGKVPTPEKPKSKGKNKLLLPIIGGTVGTLVVFGGIFAFLMSMDNDDAQRRQQQLEAMQAQEQQVIAQQQQMQPAVTPPQTVEQQQAIQQEAAEQPKPVEQQQNATSQQPESVTQAGQVGAEMNNSLVFDADGNVTGTSDNNTEKRRTRLTTEELLASKDLNEYTEDELNSAYQIVDIELTNITKTQQRLISRMKELGIEPPISQLEARQAIHDKALLEEITARLSEKMNLNMMALNKKMDDLNQSQIILGRDVANSLANVMHKISIEDLNAKKHKKDLDELTKANDALLGKYTIKQMASGRVWIIDPVSNKAMSYTIGDNIGDGIVIENIDLSNYKITTNKGEIKYNFK